MKISPFFLDQFRLLVFIKFTNVWSYQVLFSWRTSLDNIEFSTSIWILAEQLKKQLPWFDLWGQKRNIAMFWWNFVFNKKSWFKNNFKDMSVYKSWPLERFCCQTVAIINNGSNSYTMYFKEKRRESDQFRLNPLSAFLFIQRQC